MAFNFMSSIRVIILAMWTDIRQMIFYLNHLPLAVWLQSLRLQLMFERIYLFEYRQMWLSMMRHLLLYVALDTTWPGAL